MTSFHPIDANQLSNRNRMLSVSLRPDGLSFPITAEYPIVLNPGHPEYSFVVTKADQLVAHANWWPRQVVDQNHQNVARIALIGNVATDPQARGQGHMRHLFAELEQHSRNNGCVAMLLWSDLDKFYQKLGFTSLGQELRIMVNPRKFGMDQSGRQLLPTPSVQLTSQDLADMLKIRPRTPLTLARSLEEFRTLLQIPHLQIWIDRQNQGIQSYALMGKGFDMQGVVHEWGGSPLALSDSLAAMAQYNQMREIMVLAPGGLDQSWLDFFGPGILGMETHAMGLVKWLSPDTRIAEKLSELFIWGLDSI